MSRRLRAGLVGVSALASLLAGGRAQGADEDPMLQKVAATYYADKYHLDLDEAMARLSIQDRAAGIEDDIAAVLGDQFAGIWYDGRDKGRLKIGMTDRAASQADKILSLATEHGVADEVDLVPVLLTEGELVTTQAKVRRAIPDLLKNGHARTAYDTSVNAVILTALATLPRAEEESVRSLSALPGVVVRRNGGRSLTGEVASCNITYCDAPLRGGRQMSSAMGGGCTAAFMARWRPNPSVLLAMTAGHCDALVGGSTWSARDEANHWHDLGSAFATLFAGGTGLDAGTIRIDSDSFWASPSPAPWVVVKNGPNTTYNPTYAIRSDSYSSMGQVLCRTGQVSGTHCAEVSGLGSDMLIHDFNGNYYQLYNMGELDMCDAQPGDSGGPIYKSQRAYGIFSSVLSVPGFSCYEVYQGIRGAEKALDTGILLAP